MKNRIYLFLIAMFFLSGNALAQTISTYAGNHSAGYTGNGGPATIAELYQPNQLTVDGLGNIYIAESGNNVVRKVSTAGIISVVAGNHISGSSGDGGPATAASLAEPLAVAFDGAGNLYISEYGSNNIRKVSTSGTITTVVGNSAAGFSGDGGPATNASLDGPFKMTFDAEDNMYIADMNNNRIRKVNAAGNISTFAGNGLAAYSGDGGPATDAALNGPIDLAFDTYGNLVIAEINNNLIRMVSTSGIVSTVAGTGEPGYSGDGGPATAATFRFPYAMCLDRANNIYVTDNENAVIRRVNTSGVIKTIAGSGAAGYSGDGGLALLAKIENPGGVVTDTFGNMFIADYGNNVIRKVSGVNAITEVRSIAGAGAENITVFPNPANDVVTVVLNNTAACTTEISIADITGNVQLQKEIKNNDPAQSTTFDLKSLAAGMYFLTVKTGTQQYVTKIVKE